MKIEAPEEASFSPPRSGKSTEVLEAAKGCRGRWLPVSCETREELVRFANTLRNTALRGIPLEVSQAVRELKIYVRYGQRESQAAAENGGVGRP